MIIKWDKSNLETVCDVAAREVGESCGVIFGYRDDNGDVYARFFMFVANRHPDPVENFRMDRGEVRSTVRNVLEHPDAMWDNIKPLGYWHTHMPHHSPEPSASDIRGMKRYRKMIGLVIHPDTRLATFYTYDDIIIKDVSI